MFTKAISIIENRESISITNYLIKSKHSVNQIRFSNFLE